MISRKIFEIVHSVEILADFVTNISVLERDIWSLGISRIWTLISQKKLEMGENLQNDHYV